MTDKIASLKIHFNALILGDGNLLIRNNFNHENYNILKPFSKSRLTYSTIETWDAKVSTNKKLLTFFLIKEFLLLITTLQQTTKNKYKIIQFIISELILWWIVQRNFQTQQAPMSIFGDSKSLTALKKTSFLILDFKH